MTKKGNQEKDKIIEAFNSADVGVKNRLTLREFKNAVDILDHTISSWDIRVIFHQIDTQKRGYIELNQFVEQFAGTL